MNNSHCINGKRNELQADIKIAYICLCHIDPEFLKRMAKALMYRDDAIFIHVDNKVSIKPFIDALSCYSHVHFVLDRVDNYWGGFNSVEATIRTIKLALATDHYDRFVLLQGQDYPIKSPKEIHKFFLVNSNSEFCHAIDISYSNYKIDYMKCCGYWSNDYNRNILPLRIVYGLIHRFNKIGFKYRRSIFRYDNINWHIFHGWAQWALTYECIAYIIDFYESNPAFNNFMKHRFPPDELYFQTILHNSKYKRNLSNMYFYYRSDYKGGIKTLLNLTYFEYPFKVTVFTDAKDYDWLKKTGCLFVRKVNSTSKELLDKIDENILYEVERSVSLDL